MRTALYYEGEFAQIVLTPENEQEKEILKMLEKRGMKNSYTGSFYHCRGGWLRQGANGRVHPVSQDWRHPLDDTDSSLILVLDDNK